MINKLKYIALAATMAATMAATIVGNVATAANERFVLISHAPDSDSWWNTIKNALKHSAKQFDVKTEYRNPPTGDLGDMARILDQTIASNPTGIIIPISDYDVLKGGISKAIKKGIPVITINSGSQAQSEKLGALMHIGQPEYAAGLGAGKRAKKENPNIKSFLCVNHYMTNPASVERCQGFADGIGVKLGNQMIDSGQDPVTIKNGVLAYLRKNPNTDAVLTLGPTSAHPTLAALRQLKNDKIYFGTFDLSDEISQAIESGEIKWGIDQQPYLQGWMPVAILTNYARYGVVPGNHINTGPGFVTKDNLSLVKKWAGETR